MVSSLHVVGLMVAVAAAQTATPDAPITAPTACAQGLQIFVARGSNEAPGVGRIRTVAGNVTAAIPDSFVTAVDYPASFDNYAQSVSSGSSKLKELVVNYVNMCPESKIALLGYSQGAQAVADVICGASSDGMNATKDLDEVYDKNIIAAVLFGDPTRAANQSFNLGTATTRDGLFPRLKNDACEPYTPRIRSWCDVADRYCDPATPVDATVHGSYFNKYTQTAKDFVVSQWESLRTPVKTTRATLPSPTAIANGTSTTLPPVATATATTTSPPVTAGASRSAGFGAATVAVAAGLLALLA